MLSGELWPAHPRPYLGECLSSWLVRTAHNNGLKVQTFSDLSFGKNNQIWNRDIDRQAPEWLMNVVQKKSGSTLLVTNNTTLKLYEGRLFERRQLSGQLRWVLPLISVHRKYTGYGIQYCPKCLAEDIEPYYRIVWRLGFFTFCPNHNVLLQDRCMACGASIAFHRLELGKPNVWEVESLNYCWQCDASLSDIPHIPIEIWHQGVFRRWTRILNVFVRQFKSSGPIDYQRLLLLHQICKVIVSGSLSPQLQMYLCDKTGQTFRSLNMSKKPFEQRSIAERHYVIGLAWWLIERGNRKLREAVKAKAILLNHIYKDCKSLKNELN